MCIHEDRSHDCADSDTDSSSDRVQWSYLTVLTAPLFLSLSVVSFHNHKGRQHSNSSPTEGSHDGVHMGQLTRQVHHLDELRVCGSCIHILESLACGVLAAVRTSASQFQGGRAPSVFVTECIMTTHSRNTVSGNADYVKTMMLTACSSVSGLPSDSFTTARSLR